MSINSSSPAGSQDKRQRGDQTSALYALSVKVDKINKTFASSFAADDKACIRCDCSAQHRAKAAAHLQRLEKGLTNEQKVALMDLFEMSMAAADMFLSLDEDDGSLRWAWISNKLVQMGHPALPARKDAMVL